MDTPANIIKDAVDELAQNALHSQWDNEVSESAALAAIDDQVRTDWLTLELTNRTAHSVLGDVIDYMTAEEALALLKCAAARAGVDKVIANELACEANKIVSNYEPSDAEMARTYDPTAADRRALAHEVNCAALALRMSL